MECVAALDRAGLLTERGDLQSVSSSGEDTRAIEELICGLDNRIIACVVTHDRADLLTERGICPEVSAPLW